MLFGIGKKKFMLWIVKCMGNISEKGQKNGHKITQLVWFLIKGYQDFRHLFHNQKLCRDIMALNNHKYPNNPQIVTPTWKI